MKISHQKFDQKTQSGFSLIETLVAISILLVAIGGPMSIAHKALSDANLAKSQTTAIFLAQDAIEYIKNIRDKNNINGDAWLTTISSLCGTACKIDSAADSITSCSGSCPVLKFDDTTGIYSYNGALPDSPFTRTITVVTPVGGNSNEASISVTLEWNSGVLTKSFVARENILNWNGSD